MKLANWKTLLFLGVTSIVLLANFFMKSPFLGIPALLLFIGATALALGKLLYKKEGAFFRVFLGTATLMTLLSLIGTALIIAGTFTDFFSFIALIALAMTLFGLLLVKGRQHELETSVSDSVKDVSKKKNLASLIATLPFWASVIVAFELLLSGRTGEGVSSVWLTIPPTFILAFSISALSLVILLLFTNLSVGVKLTLACVFSLLSHSLFIIVWYPGRYGDPWSHLGEARYILLTGRPYAYYQILQSSLWIDLLKFKTHYSLVDFFSRVVSIDVYWVYVLLIPVLWAVFTTIASFKIAETLAVKSNRYFPFLASIASVLFPSLIIWGAVSVPNSLGFLFFLTSLVLLLLWMRFGGRSTWVIALLSTVAAFFAHPQVGAFSLMLIFLASIVHKTKRKILWVLGFLLTLAVYPFALVLNGAYFVPLNLLGINNFIAFQTEIPQLLLIFALVGFVFGIRDRFVNVKSSLLLFVFYLVILFEYYLTKYGMSNLPYGAGRILAMADLLLVPFVALGFLAILSILKGASSIQGHQELSKFSSRRIFARPSSHTVGLFLIALFLSFQALTVLYQAYPQNELVKIQPSAYELDAIQFIDSNSPGRYVVLCEPSFASLAVGFLGADYGYFGSGRGVFGIPEWTYPTEQMYTQMTKTPSIGILQEAMSFAQADLSYFVISMRNPDFDKISREVKSIFPAYKSFGNDQLYVFWYPLPIIEEPGSQIRVIYDDGLGGEENIQTKFAYMIESEVNSSITLSGHTSYNVTDFPPSWTYLQLTVNDESRKPDDSSDINAFVYVKDLQPIDIVTIKWLLNRNFADVGWKDDSFKNLDNWRRHELYPGTIVPAISSDGNVLRMSYTFTPDNYWYYYYVTTVNIQTNDYPYILIRWRSNMPVGTGAVYFELGSSYPTIPLGSMSGEWSTVTVELPRDIIVRDVMIGLSNIRSQRISGTAILEVDYILLAKKA